MCHQKMKDIEALKFKVFAGAKAKFLVVTDEILDRWAKEFEAIEALDCTEYIMINSLIADICNRNNWLRTPGFGAEMSSFVNYCLDITKINPLEDNLVFESFVNPVLLPQIRINVFIAEGRKNSLIDILKSELPDYNFYSWAFPPIEKDPTVYEKVTVEGAEYCIQDTGIIISHKNVRFYTPKCQFAGSDLFVVKDRRFSNSELEKFKFGIFERHYMGKFESIIQQLDEVFHPSNLPLYDDSIFNFITRKENQKGLVFTHFQSNEDLLSYIKPTTIYDLSAAMAIEMSRSGIQINHYIKCKRTYSYPQYISDSRVDDLLLETYGAMIYAENFIHIAHEMAGIDLKDCVMYYKCLRLNKDKYMIDSFYEEFEKGCKGHSTLTKQDYTKLVELIKGSVVHLFWKYNCLNHAILAYWSAYYKLYFPELFNEGFT